MASDQTSPSSSLKASAASPSRSENATSPKFSLKFARAIRAAARTRGSGDRTAVARLRARPLPENGRHTSAALIRTAPEM